MKKKTLKAILAAVLAVIMTIPCFSAFAANNTLIWDFYGYEYTYDYAGEIEEGKTLVPVNVGDYIWFSFDVQNTGFYSVGYNCNNLDAWIGVPERIEEGKAYNEADYLSYSPEEYNSNIYYFEEGKNVVALDLYYFDEKASLEVEFLGAEITEIKPQYDLIYDYDVYGYEYMGENLCEFDADFDITFSEGKSITRYYLEGTSDNVISAGENTFTAKLLDKEYEFTANVYYITDYVESVEISNVEDYLYIYEYYNGIDYTYPIYETIKVKFKDGSTYTVNMYDSDTITLPNGREVYYGFDFNEDDNGNYAMDVFVGGNRFASYECEVKTVSIEENIDEMTQASQSHLSNAAYYLRRAFEVAFEDGILGFFNNGAEAALTYITWSIESFTNILGEITYLFSYLLS